MKKLRQKILDVLRPFFRLWKRLENIKNVPDDTVPVPVEDHIKLIEQAVLLLDQASNSILYSQSLKILKIVIKDPKQAKKILKEMADILQRGDQKIFLGKCSDHMLLKQNAPRKKLWRFFLLPKSPFRQAFLRTTTNSMVERDFTTVKNRPIETDIAHNMVGDKKTNGTLVSQVSKILDQNLAPLSRKFPELIPEESLTNVQPLVKFLFTGKIPNLQLAGRLAHLSKSWEKLSQDQEILSVVKGYVIPFLKIRVQKTIPK